MNAAARVINHSNVFHGQLFDLRISKSLSLALLLLLAVLSTALAVVYTTNEYRSSFSQLQQLQQQRHYLKLQWGQLLLEQASLATPARVEEIAVQQLRMRLPSDSQTYVLQSK